MRLKQINAGGAIIPSNIFLAPLAGYTNAVFRQMCARLGAGLTFTEMVSAKGLVYESKKTARLLEVLNGFDGINACQIFGNDPAVMRAACESSYLAPFSIVDINFGCPVPKIYKNGEGSALLNDIPLAAKIVSECKKSGKIITAKFRTGVDSGHIVAVEFAKAMEDAGADMITVHGRTRDKMYSGEVDFKTIAKVKSAVKIPVSANGGVFSAADAENLLNQTGADAVTVARGAMYNPWIFSEISGLPCGDKRLDVLNQLKDTAELYGERFAVVFMRKMISFYIKGKQGAANLRRTLMQIESLSALKELVNEISF